MIPFLILLIILTSLPFLTAEVHKHSSYKEYGIRLVVQHKTKPALVVGLGTLIVRIKTI